MLNRGTYFPLKDLRQRLNKLHGFLTHFGTNYRLSNLQNNLFQIESENIQILIIGLLLGLKPPLT